MTYDFKYYTHASYDQHHDYYNYDVYYGYHYDTTGDHIINNPYTQRDIAALIGISRPTLNILMNELKEDSIIDFNRKQIRIYQTSA